MAPKLGMPSPEAMPTRATLAVEVALRDQTVAPARVSISLAASSPLMFALAFIEVMRRPNCTFGFTELIWRSPVKTASTR